ncbi:MAG: Maf family protein, partial [Chthoniobacterales bacterium]
PLGENDLADYLSRVDVLDKAGAYALQEHGEMIVESVEGSRSNVVGLPLERTLAALRRFAGEA